MGEQHPAKQRLLASDRLKRRADFERVQGAGRKVHSARFLFLVLPREDAGTVARLGLTVTRKVANAVGRNRIKRVMREVFRKNRALFPSGCDVVVIAKDRAPGLGYEDTRREVEESSPALHRAASAPPQTRGPRNQENRGPVRGSGKSTTSEGGSR
jgi:ribonuclease P protein component